MESIFIIIIGLVFSILSKSVKDKKEIEKERQKRKEQIDKGLQSNTTQSPKQPKEKQKSLREVFMEELQKAGDGEGELGDIFKRSLVEEPEKEIEIKEMEVEKNQDSYEYDDSNPMSIDDQNMSEEEYREALDAKIASYMDSPTFDGKTQREIKVGKSQVKSGIDASKRKEKVNDRRQYNPFTRSLDKKDVIRGIIFSEVLGKPKSLKKREEA